MMMRTKSESDMASLEPTSPQRWPKRAAYYVQSPSHAGEDCDKSPALASAVSSMQATPAFNSPTESPSHPPAATAAHSRTSSANWRTKRLPSAGNDDKAGWPECHVIHEEPPYDDDAFYYNRHRGISTRTCQLLIGLASFVSIFTLFCLILWAASRPYGPRVSLISMTMHNFYFGQGTDSTGVPTKMATVNCSVRMNLYNPATFFGIHVTSSPINLMYSEIAIATGQLEKYYQPRKSRRTVIVELHGMKVALYGAGAALGSVNSEMGVDIPTTLVFEVRAKGHVVGKLVKSTHKRQVNCSMVIHSHVNKPLRFNNDSCLFQ